MLKVKKVIGIKTTVKDDKKSFNIFLTEPFEEYEINAGGCDGIKTSAIFTYRDYSLKVGDNVTVSYDQGFGGKAFLSDISVVSK